MIGYAPSLPGSALLDIISYEVTGRWMMGIPSPVRAHSGVGPGDPGKLAEALLRVLGERDLAQRLADGAREDARPYEWSPEGYADSVREMVDRVLADLP